MIEIFEWIDRFTWIYPTFAGAALVVFLIHVLRHIWRLDITTSGRSRRVDGGIIFSGLLLLLAGRWPYLFYSGSLNPDEAQLIAGGLALGESLAFWRVWDGTTAGPLNAMVLLPTHWLGLPLDYFNARLVGIILIFGSWWASVALVQRLTSPVIALVALAPALVLLAFTTEGDLVHYSSEHLPVFLLSLGALLLVQGSQSQFQAYWWRLSGICWGLVPWAKIQGGFIAGVLCVFAAGWIACIVSQSWLWRIRQISTLAGIVFLPTLIIGAIVLIDGSSSDLWQSYVVSNLAYAGGGEGWWAGVVGICKLAMETKDVPIFVFLAVMIWAIASGGWLIRRPRHTPLFWLGLFAVFAASLAVIVPGRGFLHYFLFLIFPVSWLLAVGLRVFAEFKPPRLWLSVFLVVAVGTQISGRLLNPLPNPVGELAQHWRFPRSELGEIISYLAEPDDQLATWGWRSELYVESGLPPATLESHTERQIDSWSQPDSYYRRRYLSEMKADPPEFFVDAVGWDAFKYFDRKASGHETFTALADFVAQHYRLVGDFIDARLYIRSDRCVEIEALRNGFDRARARALADEIRSKPPYFVDVLSDRPQHMIDGTPVSMMETPASSEIALRGQERLVDFQYGYDPKAYERSDQGNGAIFVVRLRRSDGRIQTLWYRHINPAMNPMHRGFQSMRLPLPNVKAGDHLVLETEMGPHGDGAWDWAYFARFSFRGGPTREFENW